MCEVLDKQWCLTARVCTVNLLTKLRITPGCLTAALTLAATWEGL